MNSNVKKIVLVENPKKQLLYANCHEKRDETGEEIIKGIVSEIFVEKFDKTKFEKNQYYEGRCIVNDENIYITRDVNGHLNIWQICGKVSDMENAIIPHTYYVRKIGFIIEC